MASTDTFAFTTWEDGSPTLYARVSIDVAGAETRLLQSHVNSIAYKVFADGSQVGATGSLTKTDVIYDTLQTGSIWTANVDATGYNFRAQLPAAYLPTGGTTYYVEVAFTLTGGEPVYLRYKLFARNLFGS